MPNGFHVVVVGTLYKELTLYHASADYASKIKIYFKNNNHRDLIDVEVGEDVKKFCLEKFLRLLNFSLSGQI